MMGKCKHYIKMSKKAWLMVAGGAAQTLAAKIEEEQEIMMYIADMAMELLIAESALLRTLQLINKHGEEACEIPSAMTHVLCEELILKIQDWGGAAICGFAEGDALKMMMIGLKKLSKIERGNLIHLRRQIADSFNSAGEYYINSKFKY